ncbi:hypothetical protein HD806DRAFT_521225 [Xylariaceae sp. AK1471]|nr:hypothetical protein HD806DRAFT_521225 [Xylariaceae sp. AK1471]
MNPLDGVPDMSVNGGKSWQMATLLVGSEPRAFQAHLQRLGPLAIQLDIQPGSVVQLPDLDADVFNLIMNWTYTAVPWPRVAYFAENLNATTLPLPPHIPCPDADQFTPYAKPEYTQSQAIDSFCNIAFQEQYQNFSIDELRLHFTEKARISSETQDDATEQASNQSEGASNEQEPKEDAISNHLDIPSSTPDDEATKADKLQIILLKLMIFAENYKWEPLFNAAIDAFRYGEAKLRRSQALTSHIFLAFSHCQAPSQVQAFIGDYALSLGYQNCCMSDYQELISSLPAFLSFILARMDSRIPDGYTEYDDTFATSRHADLNIDPMDRTNITYHIHHGDFTMFCACRMGDRFARPGTYVALPIWCRDKKQEEEVASSS